MVHNQQFWKELNVIKEKMSVYQKAIDSLKADNPIVYERTLPSSEAYGTIHSQVEGLFRKIEQLNRIIIDIQNKTDQVLQNQQQTLKPADIKHLTEELSRFRKKYEAKQPGTLKPAPTASGFSHIKNVVHSPNKPAVQGPPSFPQIPGSPKSKTNAYNTNLAVNKIEKYEATRITKRVPKSESRPPAPSEPEKLPQVDKVSEQQPPEPEEQEKVQIEEEESEQPKQTNTFLSFFQKRSKHGNE